MKKGFILFFGIVFFVSNVYSQMKFENGDLMKKKILSSETFNHLNNNKYVEKVTNSKGKINTRSATQTDTFIFSYFDYSENYSGLLENVDFNSTFTFQNQQFPRAFNLTNYIDTLTEGNALNVSVKFTNLVWNGVNSSNQYLNGEVLYDSSTVYIDSLYLIQTALFCDTNKLDGDSIVITINELLNNQMGNELKKYVYKDKSQLMAFYNQGRYYNHIIPVKLQLLSGQKFGVNVKYFTDNKDTNSYSLQYGYLDSCKTIAINGQNFLTPAHKPVYGGTTEYNIIETNAAGTSASSFLRDNSYTYPGWNGFIKNCTYIINQEVRIYVRGIVTTKLSAVLLDDFSPKKQVLCPGESVIIYPDVNGGKPPYKYSWTSTSGTIDTTSTGSSFAIKFTPNNSNATVTLVVSDSNNDKTSVSKVISYRPSPTLALTTQIKSKGSNTGTNGTELKKCLDSAIVSATSNSSYKYSWSGGTATNFINRVFTLKAEPISITVTDANGCTASATTTITSTAPSITLTYTYSPNTPVCLNKDVVFTNTSSSITGWDFSWKDGTTVISNDAASFTHQFTTAGTKSVTLNATTSSGCVADPSSKNITVLPSTDSKCKSSINQMSLDQQVSIYPNPSKDGRFTISSTTSSPLIVNITDILGKTVYSQNIGTISKQVINLGNVQNGVYFIEINNGTSSTIQKLIMDK